MRRRRDAYLIIGVASAPQLLPRCNGEGHSPTRRHLRHAQRRGRKGDGSRHNGNRRRRGLVHRQHGQRQRPAPQCPQRQHDRQAQYQTEEIGRGQGPNLPSPLSTSQISPPAATNVAPGGDLYPAISCCIPEEQRIQNLLYSICRTSTR